jgi:hypothetical protein
VAKAVLRTDEKTGEIKRDGIKLTPELLDFLNSHKSTASKPDYNSLLRNIKSGKKQTPAA